MDAVAMACRSITTSPEIDVERNIRNVQKKKQKKKKKTKVFLFEDFSSAFPSSPVAVLGVEESVDHASSSTPDTRANSPPAVFYLIRRKYPENNIHYNFVVFLIIIIIIMIVIILPE